MHAIRRTADFPPHSPLADRSFLFSLAAARWASPSSRRPRPRPSRASLTCCSSVLCAGCSPNCPSERQSAHHQDCSQEAAAAVRQKRTRDQPDLQGPGLQADLCGDLEEYNYALETLRPGCILKGISGHYLTISKISVYSVLITFLFRSNRCSRRASQVAPKAGLFVLNDTAGV